MRLLPRLSLGLILSALLTAAAPFSPDARLSAMIAPVSGERLRANVAGLVSFNTRYTVSSQTDPKRGIGATLNWGEVQFKAVSAACGGCLVTARPATTV